MSGKSGLSTATRAQVEEPTSDHDKEKLRERGAVRPKSWEKSAENSAALVYVGTKDDQAAQRAISTHYYQLGGEKR
jgi:hypothetical protein